MLALHVNNYLRHPEKKDAQPLVSFADFSSQPLARFLPQIRRLEAYFCFLWTRTLPDFRRSSPGNDKYPLGVPIAESFQDLDKSKSLDNTHTTWSPGRLLNSALCGGEGKFALRHAEVPQAQYVDPGKGDVVTHPQELVEKRALQGAGHIATRDSF